MRILHLTLKKRWFDMIASGEKTEEYREMKPYWHKRLLNVTYDVIHFRNGYARNARMSLSERLRPDIECASWVIDEVKALEQKLAAETTRADAERDRANAAEQDRDEWRESTIDANKRFQDAESRVRKLQKRIDEAEPVAIYHGCKNAEEGLFSLQLARMIPHGIKLYMESIPSPDIAELQQKIEELTKQVAEGQARENLYRSEIENAASLLEHAPSLGIGGQNIVRQLRKVLAQPDDSTALDKLIAEAREDEREALGKLIHYPKCWDTACYETLEDALTEIGCNPDCCARSAAQTPEGTTGLLHGDLVVKNKDLSYGAQPLPSTQQTTEHVSFIARPAIVNETTCIGIHQLPQQAKQMPEGECEP